MLCGAKINKSIIIQIICNYIIWLNCILFAAKDKGLIGSFIALLIIIFQLYCQSFIQKNWHRLCLWIIILTGIGICSDSIFIWCKYIIFMSNPFAPYFTPPWMITIWVSFAILIFSVVDNFLNYYLFSFLSFFGFAFAYGLGVKMSAAQFPHGYLTSLLIGFTWSMLLPMAVYIYQRIIN